MIDVTRSQPAPASLAAGTSWPGADVLQRLHDDLLGKCYLCETPHPRGTFEVDHRMQRAWPAGAGRHYDWDNLFPACHECNKRRLKRVPPAGLLDPCAGDEINTRLHQKWHPTDGAEFRSRLPGDNAAASTALELEHLHNDDVVGKNLSTAVLGQIADVWRLERDLLDLSAPDKRHEIEHKLRRLLSRRAPFTALVRSVVLPQHHYLFD
jgi:hypothetical protein